MTPISIFDFSENRRHGSHPVPQRCKT